MNREGILNKVRIKMDEFTPPGVNLPFDDFIGPILDESAKEVAEIAPIHLLSPLSLVSRSTHRSITTNVATIKTSSIICFLAGEYVTISGFVAETSYNGTFLVTSVATDKLSFTFALTHADETETADTNGIITPKIVVEDSKAYVPKPDDFLRIYEFKFPAWSRVVRESVKPDSPEGKIQDNPYLKSGIGRPSVILMSAYPDGGTFREYLVCGKVELDEGSLYYPFIGEAVPTLRYIKVPTPEEVPDKLVDSLTWLCASKVLTISGYGDRGQAAYQQYGLSLTQLAKA